uniref:Uncharacterized protein n=1 Tax=Pseudonaja textilis TaxID=8673 RepID=A0A670XWQ5_PSETE
MLQPVAFVTKQNLLMAVAITVHIAKLNFVHVVEDECLYVQTRYKSSQNLEHGFIVELTPHRSLIKWVLEDCRMKKHLRTKKQSCKDSQPWNEVDLKGLQDKGP